MGLLQSGQSGFLCVQHRMQPRQNWWRQGIAEAMSFGASWQMGQLHSGSMAMVLRCSGLMRADVEELLPLAATSAAKGFCMLQK